MRIFQVSNVVGIHICTAPSALQGSGLSIRAQYSRYKFIKSPLQTQKQVVLTHHMARKMEKVHCVNNGGISSFCESFVGVIKHV